jgi:hypothetical protein
LKAGEGLIDKVLELACLFREHCEWRINKQNISVQSVPNFVQRRINKGGVQGAIEAWSEVRDDCQLLIERLTSVRPLVIDYFLGWNRGLEQIGRLLIAGVILQCEAIWHHAHANQNRAPALANLTHQQAYIQQLKNSTKGHNDDWHRFVVHRLVYGCEKSNDLHDNKVRFVTFNYDMSLEYNLCRALECIDLFNKNDIDQFMSGERITHIYGSVRSAVPNLTDLVEIGVAWKWRTPPDEIGEWLNRTKVAIDMWDMCSARLLTIDPADKINSLTDNVREWIKNADVIYMLGYGFDENNSDRIGLSTVGRQSVLFTNYNDINSVNKKSIKTAI